MNTTQRNTLTFVIVVALVGTGVLAYRMMVNKPVEEGGSAGPDPETTTPSRYDHEVKLLADAFSGYAVLRSDTTKNQLARKRIRLEVVDDGADYGARAKALASGEAQLAVFTIDSLLSAGASLGDFPASIVLLIDETKGADAIVSYKAAVGSLEDMDDPDARFVLTPGSPSEFLARVAINTFSMPSLPEAWSEPAEGAGDVLAKLRRGDKEKKRAYVLWQPYVSRALELPGVHVLLGSDKLDGLIVDVLVAERRFLKEKPEVVREVVEAYLRSVYSYGRKDSEKMVTLIVEDAPASGPDKLSEKQAAELVAGIRWKNTMENYAHFGLLSGADAAGAIHVEDMIARITKVLVETGKLAKDPTGGAPNTLFYDGILRELFAAKFHPGKEKEIVKDLGPAESEMGQVRGRKELVPLSDEAWGSLAPIGSVRIPPIEFRRGASTFSDVSRRDIDELIVRLDSFPECYLRITGHARAEGDPEQNRQLAVERAEAVAAYLRERGVVEHRIRTDVATPTGKDGGSQSVKFVLGTPTF